MQDDVTDDVDQIHMGDINWWMIYQLMMWITYMQENCIK
jgi:hypothetical protein